MYPDGHLHRSNNMNNGTIVAIFVSVLGCFFIISLVFLIHQWRAATIRFPSEAPAAGPAPSTTQYYKLRRGQMVPQSDRNSIISSRSAWVSIRHPSMLFSSNQRAKSNRASMATVAVVEEDERRMASPGSDADKPRWQHRVHDLESQAHEKAPPRIRTDVARSSISQNGHALLSSSSIQSPQSLWSPPNHGSGRPWGHTSSPLAQNPTTTWPSRTNVNPQTFLDSSSRDSVQAPSPAFYKPTTTRDPPQSRYSIYQEHRKSNSWHSSMLSLPDIPNQEGRGRSTHPDSHAHGNR